MEKLFLFLAFILMLSCMQSKVNKTGSKNIPGDKRNSILPGRWVIYSFGYIQKTSDSIPQELLGHCNSCPFVFFQNDHTGFIQTEGLEKMSSFKWTIKANKLIFKNSEAVDHVILNGTYRIVVGKNKTIELVDTVRKFAYNLY